MGNLALFTGGSSHGAYTCKRDIIAHGHILSLAHDSVTHNHGLALTILALQSISLTATSVNQAFSSCESTFAVAQLILPL
jgi:hypothetical protein